MTIGATNNNGGGKYPRKTGRRRAPPILKICTDTNNVNKGQKPPDTGQRQVPHNTGRRQTPPILFRSNTPNTGLRQAPRVLV